MDQDAVTQSIEEFRGALGRQGIRASKLILFGSHATGQAREDSDIDLIVISEDFAPLGYWERVRKLASAAWEIAAPIEAIPLTQDEWDRGDQMIIPYARRDGRTVFASEKN